MGQGQTAPHLTHGATLVNLKITQKIVNKKNYHGKC